MRYIIESLLYELKNYLSVNWKLFVVYLFVMRSSENFEKGFDMTFQNVFIVVMQRDDSNAFYTVRKKRVLILFSVLWSLYIFKGY